MYSSVEGMYRSFNNLIEKLHHSTWLYLLINQDHFTTMSKYIYAFVLLGVPMPLIVRHVGTALSFPRAL
jgi:hypothetical protein